MAGCVRLRKYTQTAAAEFAKQDAESGSIEAWPRGIGVAASKSTSSEPTLKWARCSIRCCLCDEVVYSRRKASLCVLEHIQGSRSWHILPPNKLGNSSGFAKSRRIG